MLNDSLKDHRSYLYTYLLLGLGGLYVQLTFTQPEISYFINGIHHPFLDWLCAWGTHIGDGIVFFIVSVILFAFNRKMAYIFFLTYAISGLTAQGLKHFVFEDNLRPGMLLDETKLHIIDGVDIKRYHSFPSGHSTSAFAMFTLAAFYTLSKWMKPLWLLAALFAAYTRIYLLQHFFEDTLFGSVIGVVTAVLVYSLGQHLIPSNRKHE